MTTTDAPATPPPVPCRECGRPLRNAVSRVLGIGSRCRHGMPEHELTAALDQATVPPAPGSGHRARISSGGVTTRTGHNRWNAA